MHGNALNQYVEIYQVRLINTFFRSLKFKHITLAHFILKNNKRILGKD